MWTLYWQQQSQISDSTDAVHRCSITGQSCWNLLSLVHRLLYEQHTLHSMGYCGTLLLRSCFPLRLTFFSHSQIHQNTNSLHHQILSSKLLAPSSSRSQPSTCNIWSGIYFSMQLFVWQKYTFWFGIFGWLLTLYPLILIYYKLRRDWPGWNELKLTFKTLEDRASYFWWLWYWL